MFGCLGNISLSCFHSFRCVRLGDRSVLVRIQVVALLSVGAGAHSPWKEGTGE